MPSSPTGGAWDVTNVLKPFMLFDPDAILDIPYDFVDWLLDIGDTYASHTMVPVPVSGVSLLCPQSSQLNGIVTARVQKPVSGTLVVGKKYGMTCRIVTASGESWDSTLWFKIVEH